MTVLTENQAREIDKNPERHSAPTKQEAEQTLDEASDARKEKKHAPPPRRKPWED